MELFTKEHGSEARKYRGDMTVISISEANQILEELLEVGYVEYESSRATCDFGLISDMKMDDDTHRIYYITEELEEVKPACTLDHGTIRAINVHSKYECQQISAVYGTGITIQYEKCPQCKEDIR